MSLKLTCKSVLVACAAIWILASPQLIFGVSRLPFFIPFFIPLYSVPIVIYCVARLIAQREPRSEYFTASWLARIVASLIIVAWVVCNVFIIKSFWTPPQFALPDVFEAYLSEIGFAFLLEIMLIPGLSALQKNIYWVRMRKSHSLDERQLHERQQVFEISYKLALGISVLISIYIAKTLHNLPAIMQVFRGRVPDTLSALAFNFVLLLVALPLIVAAYRKKV